MYSNTDKKWRKEMGNTITAEYFTKKRKVSNKMKRTGKKTQKERECHQRKGVVENCAFPTMHF